MYKFAFVMREWSSKLRRMAPIYPPKDSPAMERGTRIHLLQEEYLKGNIQGVPNELRKIAGHLRNAKALEVKPEVSWTITEDLEVTHGTDWDRAWLRAKVDAHYLFEDDMHLSIVDLKTGKVRPNVAQKELYAAISRVVMPKARKISAEMWYSDQGIIDDDTEFTAKEGNALLRKWTARGKKMLSDTSFDATPGEACDRCAFRSDRVLKNGKPGPCDQWRLA
jgi:hypothetical protein